MDSFGRNLTWLGVQQAGVTLSQVGQACPPANAGPYACTELPADGANTTFQFDDLVRFVLPAGSSNSMLCHWVSPIISVSYANKHAVPVVANLSYTPSLTVENLVLLDPALRDPATGQPLNGRIHTTMSASESLSMPLAPGQSAFESSRDTATCIAGFINRRMLVEMYGLSDKQARNFFKSETTIRLNVRGSARNLQWAGMNFGMRIIGD